MWTLGGKNPPLSSSCKSEIKQHEDHQCHQLLRSVCSPFHLVAGTLCSNSPPLKFSNYCHSSTLFVICIHAQTILDLSSTQSLN